MKLICQEEIVFFFFNYQNKKNKKIINVNDNEENFNEEISLQNYNRDDSIDLDGVDQTI